MRIVFFIVFLVSSVALAEGLCPEHPIGESSERTKKYCDDSGELIRIESYFKDLTNISNILTYENGKIINRKVFSLEQVQTQEIDIEHLDDGSFIYTTYSTNPFRAYIKGKTKRRPIDSPYFDSEVIEEWVYEVVNHAHSHLTTHILFVKGTKIPQQKSFYSKDGKLKFSEEYILDKPQAENKVDVRIIGVKKRSATGELIGEYYSEGAYQFEDMYQGRPFPSQKELSVVVIDSGFETDHPDLIDHWYQNPSEVFDGVDNDGNGVVDDVYGYYQTPQGQSLANLRESFVFKEDDRPVVSHGSHVAGLAVKGLRETSFAGFGGDYTQPQHLGRISEFIQDHGARFINMSFSFESPMGPIRPPQESFKALEALIESNPQSLFFVAAGNRPINIDKIETYPATYDYKNIVTIGALAVSDFQGLPDIAYAKLADFSSFGEKSVDIFAPGTDVIGPFVGKAQGPLSGTSMATPKTLNVVARVAEDYPEASNAVLLKSLLLSAYIPSLQSPLPCRSGGVVYEERMRNILSLWEKGVSLFDAAILVREEGPHLEGESVSEEYFKELVSFWKNRDIL